MTDPSAALAELKAAIGPDGWTDDVARIAPHLTRLTPFLIPTTNMAMTAKLRTGLWTFEKLGGVPEAEKHEVIGLKALQRREPLLRTDRLSGAVIYPEFLTDDARLVLANMGVGLFGESDLKRLARYDAEFLPTVSRDEGEAAFARWQATVAV